MLSPCCLLRGRLIQRAAMCDRALRECTRASSPLAIWTTRWNHTFSCNWACCYRWEDWLRIINPNLGRDSEIWCSMWSLLPCFNKYNLFMLHLWKNVHNHKAEMYAHYICQSWSEIRWRIGGTVTKKRKCRKMVWRLNNKNYKNDEIKRQLHYI